MKTLIIHHLEPCWEAGYRSHGTSIEEQVENFRKHLRRRAYYRVILTRFDECRLDETHAPIANYITQVEQYSYGWDDSDVRADNSHIWCDGGVHSKFVLIANWMRTLGPNNVWISGGFDGECLDDLEVALTHLNVKYSRIPQLIV